MKLNTTDFGHKLQHPLLLALASVPLALMIILNAAPDMLHRVWCFPAVYVLLAWGCILIPGRKRLLAGVLGVALVIALQMVLLPLQGRLLLVLLPVMYIALLLASLPIGGWHRGRELNVCWYVVGIGTHILLQLVINIAVRLGKSGYEGVQILLLVSFLSYVVLLLLALNRGSLDQAAQSRRTVPLLMRRQNLAITFGLLVLAVLLAALPAIGKGLEWLGALLMQGVAFVAQLIMSMMPKTQSAANGQGAFGAMGMGAGEVAPPGRLAAILEMVLGAIAIIAVLAAAVVLGRILAKKLIRLVKQLWGALARYSMTAGEDYEDEITSTRDEPDTEREGAAPLLTRLHSMMQKERDLSPIERIRSRYRRMKGRHPEWTQANTARETLPAEAADLYERARYSGQPLTEEEADRFRDVTRRS